MTRLLWSAFALAFAVFLALSGRLDFSNYVYSSRKKGWDIYKWVTEQKIIQRHPFNSLTSSPPTSQFLRLAFHSQRSLVYSRASFLPKDKKSSCSCSDPAFGARTATPPSVPREWFSSSLTIRYRGLIWITYRHRWGLSEEQGYQTCRLLVDDTRRKSQFSNLML